MLWIERGEMAFYLVEGKVQEEREGELRDKVMAQSFLSLKPFGKALSFGLENARIDERGAWLWEEEDYCSPPLKQERQAVFDLYFRRLKTEKVAEGEGWRRISRF